MDPGKYKLRNNLDNTGKYEDKMIEMLEIYVFIVYCTDTVCSA